jgi:hypothetical protein
VKHNYVSCNTLCFFVSTNFCHFYVTSTTGSVSLNTLSFFVHFLSFTKSLSIVSYSLVISFSLKLTIFPAFKQRSYATFDNMAVLIFKNKVVFFLNVSSFCDTGKFSLNRRFGCTYHLHLQGWKSSQQEISLPTCGFLFGWLPTLNMDVIRTSETSVHMRITRRYIPEDGNILNYRCGKLESCFFFNEQVNVSGHRQAVLWRFGTQRWTRDQGRHYRVRGLGQIAV